MINRIVMLVALILSGVAAYYSIAGLVAIFSAAAIPVMIMGGTLEIAKVVATSWLFRYGKFINKWLRYYLITAISILMLITSMGIFGFLSKAHIEQTTATGVGSIAINNLERQIKQEEQAVANSQKAIDSMNRVVEQNPENGFAIRQKQDKERRQQLAIIKQSGDRITELTAQLTPLKTEQLKLNAEVGPIKYIAEMVYDRQADSSDLDRAVRWVIITLIGVFDPLALMLLIAANFGLKHDRHYKRNKRTKPTLEPLISKGKSLLNHKRKKGTIVIDRKSLATFK